MKDHRDLVVVVVVVIEFGRRRSEVDIYQPARNFASEIPSSTQEIEALSTTITITTTNGLDAHHATSSFREALCCNKVSFIPLKRVPPRLG